MVISQLPPLPHSRKCIAVRGHMSLRLLFVVGAVELAAGHDEVG